MKGPIVKQQAAIGVEEFRQILDDITDHFCLLKAKDLESCSLYLLDSLREADLLSSADENEYLCAIDDFLHERFPGYHSVLFLDPIAA